jgi:hypothetical protein
MAAVNPPTQLGSPPLARRIGLWLTILILVGLGSVLTWRGYDFYSQSLGDRGIHPDYRTLSPAGFLGHGYGIIGTALILSNLAYLVRRRFTKYFPEWMGSVKAWLNMHAFTGLTGSLLVLFHSAFQLRTPIATVTSVSLAIVVVTGLVGFYIYSLVPKAGLKPLSNRLDELRPLLPGLCAQVEEFVKKTPATSLPHDASFTRTLITVPRWIMEARRRRRDLRAAAREDKMVRVLERTDPKLAHAFYAELGDLAAREVDTNAGAAMMRSWRSLHRFLALLMIVSVSVHIGVAWYYGFRWIFE